MHGRILHSLSPSLAQRRGVQLGRGGRARASVAAGQQHFAVWQQEGLAAVALVECCGVQGPGVRRGIVDLALQLAALGDQDVAVRQERGGAGAGEDRSGGFGPLVGRRVEDHRLGEVA